MKYNIVMAIRGDDGPTMQVLNPQEAIRKVIFNNPATIVLWADGSKTVVKSGVGTVYDPEKGLAMAISKKFLGNTGKYYNTFRKHLEGSKECDISKDFINLNEQLDLTEAELDKCQNRWDRAFSEIRKLDLSKLPGYDFLKSLLKEESNCDER